MFSRCHHPSTLAMPWGWKITQKERSSGPTVIASIETETTSDCVIKQVSILLLDAITTAASAWDDVSQQTIVNCFRHASFIAAEPASDKQPDFGLHEEIRQLMSRLPDQDTTAPGDYINIDTEVLTSAPLTDEEIVASVQHTGNDDSEGEEEETDETACVSNILPSSAMQAVVCLRNFVLQQQNSQDMLRHINGFETFVEDVTTNSCRQATISEFFTKK
ncbi:tigger transposable element-derived protein [Plakobranchus ocellatus]|uniref:Tigger transposable element-derived protein n=1 Tax=Plakobranchus ocellatus TaxID=259542 RepID=A0AAV3Y174_9GAST|nr:tigger transposable element-derived protein [Plakobranchus ocellatus]